MTDLPVTVLLVIYALAVARVTGLIVSDSITEPVRDRLVVWLDGRPGSAGAWFATLITCPWCAGMWVSLAGVGLVLAWGLSPVMIAGALVLAFSQVTGMISGIGRG